MRPPAILYSRNLPFRPHLAPSRFRNFLCAKVHARIVLPLILQLHFEGEELHQIF